MKLYTFDIAPNPRRVALFMQYKGITLDTQQIDLGKLEQFSDSYKAINPDCSVPALALDSGDCLVDVVAICSYLEGVHPDKPLLGADNLKRAQVLGWMHRLYLSGFMAVADMLRNQGDMFKDRALPGPDKVEQIPALVSRGRDRLAGFFRQMNSICETRDYLVGDSLTQADIDLLVVCEFAAWVKETVPESCAALLAHMARVRAALPAS
ncbi:glutathione S-transferase family protein [Litorivivens sp.]|uniref:glutathione S-transferase family protein n=1 Tax=Litorivivens sp. TaxID=2020868 RepID=UPI003561AE88